MAINVSFNGATIYKPGAYSKTNIDLGGGFPLSPTGIVAILGEAAEGTPGASEHDIGDNVFSPEQLPEIKQKYKSGPIVDACSFLFAPGADGAIPSGAQAIYIYKTNASVRASLNSLGTSWGNLKADKWGVAGNLVSVKNVLVAETPATTTGSVVVASGAVNTGQGDVLTIAINGAAPVAYTIAASASRAALITNLNAAFTGLTFSATAGNLIKIDQTAGSNIHRDGKGRSFEVIAGAGATDFGFTAGLYTASAEPSSTLTVTDNESSLVESSTVGGDIVMSIGFQASGNDASAATVSISATAITLTVTGGAQAGATSLTLASYGSISQLVSAINLLPKVSGAGWSAAVSSNLLGQLNPSVLDRVSSVGALSNATLKPARIKRDADRVRDFFALSSNVDHTVGANSYCGLMDALSETSLTGGTLGATASAEITSALSKFEKVRANAIVPLFSRDATDDISDGLTDASSTYTIDAIHAAVKTHLSLMATTKRKSERQGYLSFKGSYSTSKVKAQTLAYARAQMTIQDIKQIDSDGNIKWFQPWASAAMLAGARAGSPIGNPMTFKYFNMSGIRQTASTMSTAEADVVLDFDPDTQYDDAIANGISFWEHPQSGGFRLVVDNTTYGKDGNWVYNRGNVLYAADVLAYDFRNQLENIYVGLKNTVSAAEIKSTCESILGTYLAQGITVSTADAKNGFKQLVVQINGNTVNISVVVKLVEGIDFILADITLQRAQNQA